MFHKSNFKNRKIMKRIMKIMAMAVVAVVTTACFASCSKSDDESGNGSGSNYYGEMKLNLKVSEDVLSLADITINYTDANSTEHTEKLTSAGFKQNFRFNSLPARAKYKISYKMKETTPSKETFDITYTDDSYAAKTDGTKSAVMLVSKKFKESLGVNKQEAEGIIKLFCNEAGFDQTLQK